jgi:hypothetical protein
MEIGQKLCIRPRNKGKSEWDTQYSHPIGSPSNIEPNVLRETKFCPEGEKVVRTQYAGELRIMSIGLKYDAATSNS